MQDGVHPPVKEVYKRLNIDTDAENINQKLIQSLFIKDEMLAELSLDSTQEFLCKSVTQMYGELTPSIFKRLTDLTAVSEKKFQVNLAKLKNLQQELSHNSTALSQLRSEIENSSEFSKAKEVVSQSVTGFNESNLEFAERLNSYADEQLTNFQNLMKYLNNLNWVVKDEKIASIQKVKNLK